MWPPYQLVRDIGPGEATRAAARQAAALVATYNRGRGADLHKPPVESAQLRGEISTGLESIKGSLALLVDRTNRTDADLKQLRQDTDADVKQLRQDVEDEVKALRGEVEELKKSRWPLAQLGAVVAVGALAAAVVALFVR